ncbi:hypothetical protein ACWEQL_40825 [Kitasatospora sp. NPDC004240]
MQIHPSRTFSRAALGAAVFALVLTATACGPENDPEAAAPATTATAVPTGAPAPAATTGTPTATATARPSAGTPSAGNGTAARRTVHDEPKPGGLPLATGDRQPTDVPVNPGDLSNSAWVVSSAYEIPGRSGGRPVFLLAIDHVPEDTNRRREFLWRGLIDYAVGNGSAAGPVSAQPYPAGPLGGSLECFTLPTAPAQDTICGWADDGTVGVALFPQTAPAEAAKMFLAMRGDLEK